jgi:hypothetical protein
VHSLQANQSSLWTGILQVRKSKIFQRLNLSLDHVIIWLSKNRRKSKYFVKHWCKPIIFSHNNTPPKKLKSKVGNSQIVPDPERQDTQENPPVSKVHATQQNPSTPPAPNLQIIHQNPTVYPSHRPFRSTRRPIPSRSSLVQAFQQILARQNDAEYITLSSGDEDDNYYWFKKQKFSFVIVIWYYKNLNKYPNSIKLFKRMTENKCDKECQVVHVCFTRKFKLFFANFKAAIIFCCLRAFLLQISLFQINFIFRL